VAVRREGRSRRAKAPDHKTLRLQPGRLLTRFAIAGVGSSDVGAAAFARTVADRYREPVGAIVAGYGVDDLLAEALGGWLVLGTANRILQAYHEVGTDVGTLAQDLAARYGRLDVGDARDAARRIVGRNDSGTLLRLFLDEDRTIASVAGHSKGSLSIAYALEALVLTDDQEAIARARAARITTAGAVVELPAGFDNAGQYIGEFDWFGGLNSRLHVEHEIVPTAWHHLNTSIPLHMDFAAVLAHEPG
jgi:hypothetical protein